MAVLSKLKSAAGAIRPENVAQYLAGIVALVRLKTSSIAASRILKAAGYPHTGPSYCLQSIVSPFKEMQVITHYTVPNAVH
jgi:hypothetical protein